MKKNETLWGIAKQHGTTVAELRKINNLDPKNDKDLQIGTNLKVPQKEIKTSNSVKSEKLPTNAQNNKLPGQQINDSNSKGTSNKNISTTLTTDLYCESG